MRANIKNNIIGYAGVLFTFANASQFGATKDPFFLFGTIMGIVSATFFLTSNK